MTGRGAQRAKLTTRCPACQVQIDVWAQVTNVNVGGGKIHARVEAAPVPHYCGGTVPQLPGLRGTQLGNV